MHLSRSEAPVSWPVSRKGNTFVVVPLQNKKDSLPVLVAIRDILKMAKTRTEAKRIIHQEKVSINGKKIKDEKRAILLMDVLGVEGKSYKLAIKNGKFRLEETKETRKTAKVIGKKMLPRKRVQINLNDGRNFLTSEKVNVNDSVVFDFKENKIAKIIPMKEGEKAIIIKGSHMGEEGKIGKIDEKSKSAEIDIHHKKVKLKFETFMAV